MKPRMGILAVGLLCSLQWGLAHAQPPESTNYKLQPESLFSEGCLDPCMCPIWATDELRGAFVLILLPDPVDGFHMYEVRGVGWEFRRGTETIPVMGSGSYAMNPDEELQQLVLDLEIGSEPAVRFDSGLVAMTAEFPKIEIAIAMNGFYCYDQVFEISALRVPSIPVYESSWGVVKARYHD